MKTFFLTFLILNSTAWAQSSQSSLQSILSNGFSVLNNPAEHTNQLCSTTGSTPSYCSNVVEAVCDFQKPRDSLRDMDRGIRERFFRNMNLNEASDEEIRNAALPAIREAENQTFNRSPVTREEVSGLFNELKSSLRNLINQNPNISAEIRPQMLQKLEESNLFLSGEDFMQADIERQAAIPGRSLEERTARAFGTYENFCDVTGTTVNAFNFGGKILLCPGLFISLLDRNPSRSEFLNALAFTIGHELSHSIGPQHFPDVYASMGECYNTINNDPNYWNGIPLPEGEEAPVGKGLSGDSGKPTGKPTAPEEPELPEPRNEETAADYWGAQLLGERITSQGVIGSDMIRTIGHASDDFCNSHSGPQYAPGNDRISLTIARNPTIRESLGCGQTQPQPVCSLSGTQTLP